jgi:predicted nucleic acid-binding protein
VTVSPLYFLDTNILIHFVRGTPLWRSISQRYQLLTVVPSPLFSVITEGELQAFALKSNWGSRKRDQLDFILGYFSRQIIDDEKLIRWYATMDEFSERIGHPLGKNDLWIAATAATFGATLLTTDRDFDRLSPQFLTREWIDPNTP